MAQTAALELTGNVLVKVFGVCPHDGVFAGQIAANPCKIALLLGEVVADEDDLALLGGTVRCGG